MPPGAQLLRTRSAPQQHPVQLQYQTSDRRALAMGVSNLALRNGHSQHRIDQLAEPLLTIMVPPVIESQLASDRRQPWAKRLQSLYMPEFLPRCNLHSVRDRCGALSRGPYDWSDPGHYSVKPSYTANTAKICHSGEPGCACRSPRLGRVQPSGCCSTWQHRSAYVTIVPMCALSAVL